MTCPHCVKYIPALAALVTKVKVDRRSRFILRDREGNVYLFRVATKSDSSKLKEIEGYFNSLLPNDEYTCKLGVKDKQLALLYLDKSYYDSKIKNYFKHRLAL